MLSETIREIDRQRKRDTEREEREAREKAYVEATHSASFSIFDSVMGTVTVIISVLSCVYFLWKSSIALFVVVLLMLALSYIFRKLSKYYFMQGNMQKFATFNKLAGVMGVSTSLVEFADYRKGATKSAFSKAESLEESLTSTWKAVTEVAASGSFYAEKKYNSYRERCIKLGRFVYYSGEPERAEKILNLVKAFEKEHDNFPKECATCINVLYMYFEDFRDDKYKSETDELAMASLGALHFFTHPINNIPDTIPIAGYRDNMFMPLCVTGGYVGELNAYKDWKVSTSVEREAKSLSHKDGRFIRKLAKTGEDWYPAVHISQLAKLYERKNELNKLRADTQEKLINMCMLCHDYLTGRYPYILLTDIYICFGAIKYWLTEDDMVPDYTPITGYVDDDLVIQTAYKCLEDKMQEYVDWLASVRIGNKIDPLIDYLDSIIGEDETARNIEIVRLSGLCNDKYLTDDMARARAVVVQLL